MTADLLLNAMLVVGIVSAIASQRLVGAKPATGPTGALIVTNACRLLVITGWVWFGFLTGYWQIPAMTLTIIAIGYVGILAKRAAA